MSGPWPLNNVCRSYLYKWCHCALCSCAECQLINHLRPSFPHSKQDWFKIQIEFLEEVQKQSTSSCKKEFTRKRWVRAKKDAEHCRQVSASYLTPFEVPSSLINTIVVDCRKCLSAEQSNSPLKPACNQLLLIKVWACPPLERGRLVGWEGRMLSSTLLQMRGERPILKMGSFKYASNFRFPLRLSQTFSPTAQ